MNFNIKTYDNYYCIDVSGEMVAPACNRIANKFCSSVPDIDKPVIIDLTKTTYIDSRGLGVMVFLYTHTKKMSHSFLVSGVREEVSKIIKITALDKIFPVFQTHQEAIDSLKS